MFSRKTKFKRGFTLLEVLVATTIFAMIMLITTGTVAQSSTYRSKLKTMREVNEETRKLADKITRDVRESNYPARIEICGESSCPLPKNFKNGIAIIYVSDYITGNTPWGSFRNNLSPHSGFATESFSDAGQVLITTDKNSYKVLYAKKSGTGIYYKEFPRVGSSGNLITLTNVNLGEVAGNATPFTDNLINNTANVATLIYFSGFCSDDSIVGTAIAQPYVQFYITSKTADYDNLPATQRAQAVLRSMVTGRSYNN